MRSYSLNLLAYSANEKKLVKGAVEEYRKLCTALSQIVESLPRIELYTEAFLDSDLVKGSVNHFYVSVLRFWTRACKFYSRHRLWNVVRVVWNDYDDEFRELQNDMTTSKERVESMVVHNCECLKADRKKVRPLLFTSASRRRQERSSNMSIRRLWKASHRLARKKFLLGYRLQ